MESYGALSLLPVAVVIVLVFLTRRTAASLAAGSLVGAVMLWGTGFAGPWLEDVYVVLGSRLYLWIVLVCGIFGGLVELFELSGGIYGFNKLAARVCTTPRRTMLCTWVLGLLTFIDDWLSILTAGTVMRGTADRMGISRERLALLANATASSVCVIVPISTWGVFMISQIVAGGVCAESEGLATFLKVLPCTVYPFMALLFGFLLSLGVIPLYGPIRNALPRPAEESGGDAVKSGNALNLILPIVLVTAVTIATGEILYGTMLCLVFCAVLYLPQRLMTPAKYLDAAFTGFKGMLGVLVIVACAFLLREINSALGMPEYVIGVARAAVPPAMLPAVTFLLITALAVAAGNFWGICAIAFPVIIPIAQAIGADVLITAGAIISATAAGSHFCFFGSEATLTCSTMQIENVRYAQTCVPMLVLPFAVSAVIYVILGAVV